MGYNFFAVFHNSHPCFHLPKSMQPRRNLLIVVIVLVFVLVSVVYLFVIVIVSPLICCRIAF